MDHKIPRIDYEFHPEYGMKFNRSMTAKIRAIYIFVPKFLRNLLRFSKRYILGLLFEKKKPVTVELENELYHDLVKKGIGVSTFDTAVKKELLEQIQVLIEELEKRRQGISPDLRTFSDNQLIIEKSKHNNVFHILQTYFEKSKIMESLQKYGSSQGQIKFVALQINDFEDMHWKHVFDDPSVPNPKLNYLHVDTIRGFYKSLIYIDVVDENSGPFNYILGSHRLKIGFIESVIRSTNDHCGLSERTKKARELFYALPRRLRLKAAFGADILDDSDEEKAISALEHQYCSSQGDIITFDPMGMHRGGMVKNGKRIILQIGII
jgi:hypothetical protein